MAVPLFPLSPRFHWAVLWLAIKMKCGANSSAPVWCPLNCFATGEHASDGTTRECVCPDFLFLFGMLRLRHAEICVCAVSTCGLTPTPVWEKSNWPRGCACPSSPLFFLHLLSFTMLPGPIVQFKPGTAKKKSFS